VIFVEKMARVSIHTIRIENIKRAREFLKYRPKKKGSAYYTSFRIGNFGIFYRIQKGEEGVEILMRIVDFRNPIKREINGRKYNAYKIYAYEILEKMKKVHYYEFEKDESEETYDKISEIKDKITFETKDFKLVLNKDGFKIEFPKGYEIINHRKE
jgi:mRNA-degrading endonuclease RelE of RelBE toxin-antitoxin system